MKPSAGFPVGPLVIQKRYVDGKSKFYALLGSLLGSHGYHIVTPPLLPINGAQNP